MISFRKFFKKEVKSDLISISPHNLKLFEYFIIKKKKKIISLQVMIFTLIKK